MAPRTRFLSRLIGLYCVLGSLSMSVHKQATVAMVDALIHNSPLLFMSGVITLGAGLAIVLGHNVWSGGLLPVVVTLTGWVAVIKGLLFLFLSPEAAIGFWGNAHYEQLFYLYAGISFALGAYLTYEGFKPGNA